MSDDGTKPAARFSTPKMVAIEAEVVAARAELASTVDALTSRLDPRTQAARAVETSKRVFRDAVDPNAAPEARRRSLTIVGGVAAGIIVVAGLVWLRRR